MAYRARALRASAHAQGRNVTCVGGEIHEKLQPYTETVLSFIQSIASSYQPVQTVRVSQLRVLMQIQAGIGCMTDPHSFLLCPDYTDWSSLISIQWWVIHAYKS